MQVVFLFSCSSNSDEAAIKTVQHNSPWQRGYGVFHEWNSKSPQFKWTINPKGDVQSTVKTNHLKGAENNAFCWLLSIEKYLG